MNVVKVEEVETTPNPHGVDVGVLYDVEKVQVVHVTLKSDKKLKRNNIH
jgi:hypothetical protein